MNNKIKKKTSIIAATAITILLCSCALIYLYGPFLPLQKNRIFYNGTVLTMDSQNSVHTAVAVKDGVIVALGNYDSVKSFNGWFTESTDLKGKTIVPGFIDAHSHFPGTGLLAVAANLYPVPDGPVQSISHIVSELKKQAEKPKPEGLVFGFGYDDTALEERRHPTRMDLDQVSTNLPVLAKHSSGHITAVNSKALELLGYDDNSPDPPGGTIERDPITGKATGVLFETAGDRADQLLKNMSLKDSLSINMMAVDDYISQGITTAQSGKADHRFINSLARASKFGILPLRIVVWPDEDISREIINGDYNTEELSNDWFSVGAHKLTADGSVQGYTSYMTVPYFSGYKGDKSFKGYPRQTRELLVEKVSRIYQAGLQVAIHGNADAAIDDILYAIEKAQERYPLKDARPLIIHAQIVREDQLDKMEELGISPSFFNLHVYYWGDRHLNTFLGPTRAEQISPANSALKRNLRITLHSDAPVVSNVSPLFIAWTAVNRQTSSGVVLGHKQRISVLEALRAVTINAAWQMRLEDTRGSLEIGKFADLVVLDQNPLNHPQTLNNISVLETIVDGRSVYKQSY